MATNQAESATDNPAQTPSDQPASAPGGGQPSGYPQRRPAGAVQPRRSELVTPHGKASIAESVVEKIAGVSASEINGVHAMGKGRARTLGAIRDKLPVVSGPSPAQGVSVEVGERQAAVDLDLVVDYGISIVSVAQAVRENVISNIERMTGLEVTEVNVAVDDVWMGEDEEPESRVQ
jgi:uncharacterized alkaline shock family protein YloU